MKKTPLILVAAGLLVGLLSAGNDWADKPFLEWSEKEAKSILQLSPWSKTQTIADLPTPQARPRDEEPSEGSGTSEVTLPKFEGTSDLKGATYSIGFLSALPVRLAVARRAMLQGSIDEEQAVAFANQGQFDDHIVVSVSAASSGRDLRAFLQVSGVELQDSSYLRLRQSKEKIYLQEYISPAESANGQPLFVFPRKRAGQDLIQLDQKAVTFFAPINNDLKLERSFSLKNMVYQGKLEL